MISAVGVAVAAHVSGTWSWSVHTDTMRWRDSPTSTKVATDLAFHSLEQIHDRLGEQVCVVSPPELELELPTGREEVLRRAAEHTRRAARTTDRKRTSGASRQDAS
ncbi:hypothetical protein AB0M72_06905 [Nocardiopsis dassonvillei]